MVETPPAKAATALARNIVSEIHRRGLRAGDKLLAEQQMVERYGVARGSLREALRYLDVHPVLPDDAPSELTDKFNALRTPLLLNSALAAFKSPGGAQGARIALDATTTALELPNLSDADRGA